MVITPIHIGAGGDSQHHDVAQSFESIRIRALVTTIFLLPIFVGLKLYYARYYIKRTEARRAEAAADGEDAERSVLKQ